ncbi:MAG: DNA-binding protein [Spirochaetales bacterium]|nr:DNA-binding protein [Spirochaetales bacterium]
MAILKEINPVKTYLGKLSHNTDLLEELTGFCISHNITLGRIDAVGAVQKARLAYYDQENKTYRFFTINRHLEITSLTGNITIKDGKPIVHVHITLADKKGNAFGGHLAEGTIVFACEVCIQVFQGETFKRGFDRTTGLPLWEMGE